MLRGGEMAEEPIDPLDGEDGEAEGPSRIHPNLAGREISGVSAGRRSNSGRMKSFADGCAVSRGLAGSRWRM